MILGNESEIFRCPFMIKLQYKPVANITNNIGTVDIYDDVSDSDFLKFFN